MPMAELYKMTVDLNVLDHLWINLYSNIKPQGQITILP